MMYMASFYGLWNLDFFLFLYNLTCVSPTITATQSYFIEVAIGVYPLVLLVILYSFVTLHDHGCRIVVKIWKPFHFLIFRFHRKLHLKTSLIATKDFHVSMFLPQLHFTVQMAPIAWFCTWIPQ